MRRHSAQQHKAKVTNQYLSGWFGSVLVQQNAGYFDLECKNTMTQQVHRECSKKKNFMDFLTAHQPTDAAAHQGLSWHDQWPVWHCICHLHLSMGIIIHKVDVFILISSAGILSTLCGLGLITESFHFSHFQRHLNTQGSLNWYLSGWYEFFFYILTTFSDFPLNFL